ncbi:hypothetical protein QM012_001433 [Aureobasidium pullulans]|uniref:MYND-type domain-containing protein n=1 Tax=Aureobasidium pullulans TaxID=5580 RepID=A0ABR0TE11_AURPU
MSAGKCEVCLEEKLKLVTCGRCGNRKYCGAGCQRKNWPTHKHACQPKKQPSWILKITIPDSRDPQIWRTLVCPDGATFQELHYAIQVAFGWAAAHSYDFVARDPTAEERSVADIRALMQHRMALDKGEHRDFGPRQNFIRIINPDDDKMTDSMHAYGRKHSQTPEKKADKVCVGEQFNKKEWKDAEWEYMYDFGNNWGHEIEIIGRGKVDDVFECTSGNGHAIAEDVGSMSGWEELKNAYRAAQPDNEQKKKMHWFENSASNFDPEGLKERESYVDLSIINALLRTSMDCTD